MSPIRVMTPEHSKEVAAMVRQSTDPRVMRFVPYCQPSAERYLRTAAEYEAHYPELLALVAVDECERVSGFAQFRLLPSGEAHLAHFYVRSDVRGRGIGRELLRMFVRTSDSVTRVTLSVFENNVSGGRLYGRLGFQNVGSSAWLIRSAVPRDVVGAPVNLSEPHIALASLSTYGFGRFVYTRQGRTGGFGVVGDSLRVDDWESLADDALLTSLMTALPFVEQVFLIARGDADRRSAPHVEQIAVARTLEATLATLAHQLG